MKKKVLSIMLTVFMLFAMYVPTSAQQTITVSVKIRTTALNGAVLAQNSSVTLPEGSTALDALRATVGGSESHYTSGGITYYTQGILKWRSSQYGNYVYAVEVDEHGEDDAYVYFLENGSANEDWDTASHDEYGCLSALNSTESDLDLDENSTFNNMVHTPGLLSEFDYNNYSGWMIILGGSTDNLGVDTELVNGQTVDLNYTMMMGLDLGQDSWMENSNHQWVQVNRWNTYSFTNNVW